MDKGFLYRRLSRFIPCVLKGRENKQIKLYSKHAIASFQDVYLNPFYWEALVHLNFIPKNVYDLGANFGYFSSLCYQYFDYKYGEKPIDYYLIEANKKLVHQLEKRKKELLNALNTKIIYGLAGPISDEKFLENNANLLASAISDKGNIVPFVDFTKLPNPDLIKIDIEGAEKLLFNHYFNWVKKARALIIEFHFNKSDRQVYEEQLKAAGFSLILDQQELSGFQNQLWLRKES